MVISFVSVTWELFREGGFIPFYFSYMDALVSDFYLKPLMTLADVSDLERVLFEPYLPNFLPPKLPLLAPLRS